MSERRNFYRVPCRIKTLVTLPGPLAPEPLLCEITDLSVRGARLRTLYPPRATNMRVHLSFNILGRGIVAEGRIARVGPASFGVAFTQLVELDEMAIAAYLYYRLQAIESHRTQPVPA